MKSVMKIAPALAVMIMAATVASADGIKLGDKMPATDLKMKNVDGREISIADVAGKNGTLVIFSCNHCPFVKGWETRTAEIGNTYLAKGIGVIQINSNDPASFPEDSFEEMQARAKKLGLQFPYVMDATSDVGRAFGATRTPEFFLFDKDGKLVYHGALDDNSRDASKAQHHYLKDALEALLAGQPVPVAETKAVGCTIKFRPKA
jgi:peroxiredoxin